LVDPAFNLRPLASIRGSLNLEPALRLTFSAIFGFVAFMATFLTGPCRSCGGDIEFDVKEDG
jgi:hypothetical protein